MIVYDVEQGSIGWQLIRMGIPTGSNFDKIITAGGKLSSQSEGYLRHLIAESLLGGPIDAPKTAWMERGSEMEGEAVSYYELEREIAAPKVGFITNDAGTVGVSPDRLIGDDGLLEIKCPAPQTHVGYLLYSEVDQAYRTQLQGQLWITGRAWVDICSYCPAIGKNPAVIVRVERDEEYIAKLAAAVLEFSERLEAEKARVAAMGYEVHDGRVLYARWNEERQRARKQERENGDESTDWL